MSSHIIVGPILGFRGVKAERWYTSALVVLSEDAPSPQLTTSSPQTVQINEKAVLLKTNAGLNVWRLDWSVQQTDEEQRVTYIIDNGQTYSYVVPEHNRPLRICYGSCFGVHTLQDVNKLRTKNAMWKVLLRVHQEQPYHLFFLGGDQVYSDQVWEKIPQLRDWLNKPLKKRVLAPFTPDMQQQVQQFYFNVYLQSWSQKQPAAILSQIPTLMMWDDHDIFDGWGSYAPVQQKCPVFQGIFAEARAHFQLFQMQASQVNDLGEATLLGKDGFTYAHRIGDIALVALDLRSERTQDQVMNPETWSRLQAWMEKEVPVIQPPDQSGNTGCKHLLLMSGIPIVNADLTLLESALDLRPGQQRMEDDLKDQWLSRAHQQERLQLIHHVLDFSHRSGCRVTIVSGDAHVAFQGFIQSEQEYPATAEANIIHQLTSSAMVNLPPSALVVYMMEKLLAGKVEKVDEGITARLTRFPGTEHRILGKRNWLSLRFDEQSCISAEWYVEGVEQPLTKVIQPVTNKAV